MIGRSFSRYRILEKIGEGGMGEVFLADDTVLDRKVAIKFLSQGRESDETARKRFLREAKSAAALDHPFICSVHEVGEYEGKQFIVMERIEGQTLKERLEGGRLSQKDAIRIALEIAEALQKAHQKGIVHRDLKPANLMLTPEGHVKVMDFGLAKQLARPDELSEADTPTGLTREGTTVGTLLYMSPEQIRSKGADARSDIFSFGVLLYEILTGVHPFKRDAAFETSAAIVKETPPPLSGYGVDHLAKLQPILDRMLAKEPEARYQRTEELASDLRALLDDASSPSVAAPGAGFRNLWSAFLRPAYLVPLAVGLVALTYLGTQALERYRRARWAREVLPGEVERLSGAGVASDWIAAFRLVRQAKEFLPNDPGVDALWRSVSADIAVTTEPDGASIYVKPYDLPDEPWQYLGDSPTTARLAGPGILHRFRIEKDGHETVLTVARPEDGLKRVLNRKGEIPAGMVRVSTAEREPEAIGRRQLEGDYVIREFEISDFYMDAHEVTNAQFMEFLRAGGYQNRDYWKHEFIREGETLTWEQAMALFIDTTGRPGPATWQAGDYPEGQDDYPVNGVSWYEAAAYAEFAGKSLPTIWHWRAPNLVMYPKTPYFLELSSIEPLSNFGGKGPEPVGSRSGINHFGVYDMAGNVREWCWNAAPNGRCLRGGAWNDASYMYARVSQADPFDRSPKNGFRCVQYLDEVSPLALEPFVIATRNFYEEKPVSDATFEVYRKLFSYDKGELRAEAEEVGQSPDWIEERVTFDAAYGNERMMAHLFLPRNAEPPFQAILYFPGSGAISNPDMTLSTSFFDFLLKSGRAVIYPIYKGTHGRSAGMDLLHFRPHGTHRYVEFLTMWVKDARRSLDYLETREDIDFDRLAFCGVSWGGYLANVIPAVEDRLRANLVVVGGFAVTPSYLEEPFPEADLLNYAPRVKIPTLMLNGRYDLLIPFETNAKPMFDFLGTPAEQKAQKVYETDHFIPRNELIKESLAFLDRYLGPVTPDRIEKRSSTSERDEP